MGNPKNVEGMKTHSEPLHSWGPIGTSFALLLVSSCSWVTPIAPWLLLLLWAAALGLLLLGGSFLWAFPGSGLLLGAAPALGRSLAVLWPLLGYSWAVALLLLLLGGFGVVFVSLWLFLGCLLV